MNARDKEKLEHLAASYSKLARTYALAAEQLPQGDDRAHQFELSIRYSRLADEARRHVEASPAIGAIFTADEARRYAKR